MPTYADCTKVMYNMPMAKKPSINLTRLKRLMDKKGWGLGELAQYSGVKYQTLYSISVGRRGNTSADKLTKIANTLDTSVDYLLGESDDDTPPIQKLPEGVRKLAEIASLLSEIRREELLRIAAALRQLEEEQPLPEETIAASIEDDLDETERIANEADKWLDSIQRTRGKDVRDEIEKIFRDKNLFVDSTS